MDTIMKNKKLCLQWVMSILVPVLILLIPLTEMFTVEIRKFFAITIFAIFLIAFDLLDALVIAVILFVGYWVAGVAPAEIVFSAWANNVAWVTLGALFLGVVLQRNTLAKRFTYFLILKLGGKYSRLLWVLYFVGLIMAVLTVNSGWVFFPAIVMGICKHMNYEIGSKEANGVMFAIMTGAVQPLCFLFSPINAVVAGNVMNIFDPTLSVTWFSFFRNGAPWLLFDLLWMVLLVKVFFKSERKVDLDKIRSEYQNMGKVDASEKKAAALVLFLLAWIMICGVTGGNSMLAFMLLVWIAVLPGVDLADRRDLKHINFGLIFFTVSCLAIGIVGNAIGVGSLITTVCRPLFQGVSAYGYIALMWFVAMISNLLLTPISVYTALGVPLMEVGMSLGVSPEATMFALVHNTTNVFLPHENSAYLLYYAVGLFTMKDFVKYNAIRMIFATIFFLVVVIAYWKLIGIFYV